MKPSAPVSSSLTNRPERVTPPMCPLNTAPTRSARKWAIRRSTVSRSAAIARRDLAKGRHGFGCGQPAIAEFEGPDQSAMHDEIRVAPDRRGEMGVAFEIEAEMSVVLGSIFGLSLAAQHDLIDEVFRLAPFDTVQDAVERIGPQGAAFRQ